MHEDQAAGLRRLFQQRAARVLLVADAVWPRRGWFALNLAAAFARAGEQVIVLDAERESLTGLWGARCRYELGHVLEGDRRLVDVLVPGPESSVILPMRRAGASLAGQASAGQGLLARVLASFVENGGLLIAPLVPARLESPLWRLGGGEVLLCADGGSAATTRAYAAIKALLALRPQPGVRVAVASAGTPQAPHLQFLHLEDVVNRFLRAKLRFAGALPAAELRQGIAGRTLYDDAPAAAGLIEAISVDAVRWRLPQLEFTACLAKKPCREVVMI